MHACMVPACYHGATTTSMYVLNFSPWTLPPSIIFRTNTGWKKKSGKHKARRGNNYAFCSSHTSRQTHWSAHFADGCPRLHGPGSARRLTAWRVNGYGTMAVPCVHWVQKSLMGNRLPLISLHMLYHWWLSTHTGPVKLKWVINQCTLYTSQHTIPNKFFKHFLFSPSPYFLGGGGGGGTHFCPNPHQPWNLFPRIVPKFCRIFFFFKKWGGGGGGDSTPCPPQSQGYELLINCYCYILYLSSSNHASFQYFFSIQCLIYK